MKKREPKNITNNMAAILRDGGEFWRTIKNILETEKREINQDVFNREDLELSDKQIDDLIRWHNFLDYVIKLPEMCIESLQEQPDRTKADDSDPYESLPIRNVREDIKNNGRHS